MERIVEIFNGIYGDLGIGDQVISSFMDELVELKKEHFIREEVMNKDWYKDAIVYSMYVDYFNKDMAGLISKLDDLKDLGVNCLWLLPILESPMKDAGFDISDYTSVRKELLGGTTFEHLIDEAHKRDIRIIFDIAMNHCSMDHFWYQEARRNPDSQYRDYFIWSEDGRAYEKARIIFKGLCHSNWEYDDVAGKYFFHRFFEIQPDLNYRNPQVLFEMTRTLVEWKIKGIDGFRADAVPYIWKEEGTICENLPKTHLVVKFMRSVLDFLEEGTLFLAEACQPPKDVVNYFGDGDECQAAYHFPVMPRIYSALASGDKSSVIATLDESVTPSIPDSSQWFMFLRCHDELTLEMVTPEEREFIYGAYAKKDLWDFRQGEGISARIKDLFDGDKSRMELAYSIMFTLLGTPIIYYGDEYAKGNDEAYYQAFSEETGYKDSRYLVRGPIDWVDVEDQMSKTDSLTYQVFHMLKAMIAVRKEHPAFSRGKLEFVDLAKDENYNKAVMAYIRTFESDRVLVIQNLSGLKVGLSRDKIFEIAKRDASGKPSILYGSESYDRDDDDETIVLDSHEVLWLEGK